MLHHALLEGEVEANGHEDLVDESFVFDQTNVCSRFQKISISTFWCFSFQGFQGLFDI